MAMGINLYTAGNMNSSIIDKSMVREITENIFQKSQTKSVDVSEKFNLSKFNRPELGVDLYSSRVNSQKAIEISVRNAGLDIQLNQNFAASIQYLNTQAALNSMQQYQKNVDGKIPVAPASAERNEVKNNYSISKTIQLLSLSQTNKDKRGSNPFSMFAPANTSEGENVETNTELNFCA